MGSSQSEFICKIIKCSLSEAAQVDLCMKFLGCNASDVSNSMNDFDNDALYVVWTDLTLNVLLALLNNKKLTLVSIDSAYYRHTQAVVSFQFIFK